MLSFAIAALFSNAHFAKGPNTCTSQMFAHRSCVTPLTKITMFPYSEHVQDIELTVQVLEMIWVLNELIQANKMVFEHYGASFEDDIDAKMNYFKHVKWLFNVY